MSTPELRPGCPWRPWLDEPRPARARAYGRERPDDRGRVLVTLHRGHRFANRSGRQYRYRLVVLYKLEELGRRTLTSTDHVDHVNGCVSDDRLENLRVLGAEYHGRRHAVVYEEAREVDGEWRDLDYEEIWPLEANRVGAVISLRPIDPITGLPETAEREAHASLN